MRIPHVALLLATVCLVAGSDSHKRTPSGFTGVRGKKSVGDGACASRARDLDERIAAGIFGVRQRAPDGWMDAPAEGDYAKRAPNGFLGMRGKKELAPAGFLGVRGKKDDEPKRAPAPGFFGVRGKKEPARAGFFGMRGKKYPYEFRGKFVGVRGKKAAADASEGRAQLLHQVGKGLDINQLMLLLTENEPYDHPDDVYQYFNDVNN